MESLLILPAEGGSVGKGAGRVPLAPRVASPPSSGDGRNRRGVDAGDVTDRGLAEGKLPGRGGLVEAPDVGRGGAERRPAPLPECLWGCVGVALGKSGTVAFGRCGSRCSLIGSPSRVYPVVG